MGSIGDCYDNAMIESFWGSTTSMDSPGWRCVSLTAELRTRTPQDQVNSNHESGGFTLSLVPALVATRH